MSGGEGERIPGRPAEVLRNRAFALFWSATTLRALATGISGVAFQVVVVTVLDASTVQVSVLSALSVAPYLVLGLIVGALMDRWRRQRTLVLTSVGRTLALAAVPILLLLGILQFWMLAVIVTVLGVLTLFADSASQPLLPRLVPRDALVAANARLGQSATVAGTAGPAIGGALIGLVGAPLLFAFEAVITAVSAVLQARIRVVEHPPAPRAPGRHLGHEIAEGMRYTYRHRTLRPLALSVHIWFLGNALASTLFGVFVLRELRLPAWGYGVALALGGVGGFLGALSAPALGRRLGAGRAILLGRALAVLPWLGLALLPLAGVGAVLVVAAAAQFVYGLAMGIEDANDTGYRQGVAPDAIQGRMNSTIRTVNRTVFFVGALLAGVIATAAGIRATLVIAAAVFAVAALVVLLSPLRTARHEDAPAT